jgi:EAL domain-containing protein (putative c-di-GMP-specific phosphodiesterase class I)
MVYNIDFDIAAILLLAFSLFYLFYKKGVRKGTNSVFLLIVSTSLVSAVADIASAISEAVAGPGETLMLDFWNHLFFIVHNLLPFLFVLYVLYVVDIARNVTKVQFILISVPVIIEVILLITNPFTRLMFYYDASGAYCRGRWFFILYIGAVFYSFLAIHLSFLYRKLISANKFISLLFFTLMGFVPVLIQMKFSHILLDIFCQSLAILNILFSIENKSDVINPNTGVYNRYAFLGAVDSSLKRGECTLIVVKLANVQFYYTTLGVEYVNGVLEEIAQWLDDRHKKLICYDCEQGHFVLYGKKISDEEKVKLKTEILERFHSAWEYKSMGSVFPIEIYDVRPRVDVETMEDLLLILDTPFDDLVSEERNVTDAVVTYQRRMLVEKVIQEALDKRKFQVWYQPILDSSTGKIVSAEALVRLTDEKLGYISPEEFVPIAEQTGMIVDIGAFVFDEVCNFYKTNNLLDLGIDYIEINLSVVQCMNSRLVDAFDKVLKKHGLEAKHINLEITESAASDSRHTLMETVNALKERGFTFSLDDYGTGYSNISYMYDMPFSIIKLDKTILWSALHPQNGMGDKNAMIFLENTIKMMKDMKYKLIAEGIETQEQRNLLKRLNCDFFQGFYFSKPVPGDIYLDMLRKQVAVTD